MDRIKRKIRNRVLRGIALNRQPGFHFPGNFLDISYDRVARDVSQLSIEPGAWCTAADGQVDLGSLAILADLALGACIRAQLSRERRLATVSMHLQFTGAPARGRLRAGAEFQGFFREAAGTLGLSRVAVAGAAGSVCYGTGSFMALAQPRGVVLHPVPLRTRRSPEPSNLTAEDLDENETRILRRADAALEVDGNFAENFWGFHPKKVNSGAASKMHNGLHVGNRVGHAQGGIMLGLAAATAAAALTGNWSLSGISAWYVSPGDGKSLLASAKVVHQGRLTAVVRTQISSKGRRRVLEVVTTHCAAGSG